MMKKQDIQKTTTWERFNHWILALSFFVLFLNGIGFLYKSLNWINVTLGSCQLASDIHKWAGVVFTVSLLLSMSSYFRESFSFSPEDRKWLSTFGGIFSKTGEPLPQGKLNAGQKLFYLTVLIFGFAIAVSGYILLYFPVSRELILFAHFTHNLSVVIFMILVPFHIYLATVANPGSLRAMTRGTVTTAWAKKHHAKWAKEMGVK